jgi:hypothetical protein
VPVAVKNLFDVEGLTTLAGSRIGFFRTFDPAGEIRQAPKRPLSSALWLKKSGTSR